ncbi:hypothetical protein KEM56_004377 [Ascosphaera pollenicola]|nr:hypothetical protein KEM56_004377 [Ascosphaera pollenicola]
MARVFMAEQPFQRGRRMRRRLSDGEKVFCVFVVGVVLLVLTNAGLVNDNLANSVSSLGNYLGFVSSSSGVSASQQPIVATPGKNRSKGGEEKRVPLEAHIMSKCPDAQYCLKESVVPVMERISDKVDFHLSFIGEYNNKTDELQCMHGPSECIGNALMLCAANLPASDIDADDDDDDDDESQTPDSESVHKMKYPKTPVIRSLGFANCLTSSYEDIPDKELVKGCALEHGINFDALNRCASRQIDNPNEPDDDPNKISGLALLRQSFSRSEKLGVDISCTVRVNEENWCVRDDGKWVACGRKSTNSRVSTLVEHISTLYDKMN